MYPMLHWLLVLLLNSSPTTASHSLTMAVGPLITLLFAAGWSSSGWLIQLFRRLPLRSTALAIDAELQAITALQLLDDDVVMAFIAQTIG